MQEKVIFATVKAHVVSNSLPHGPKHIFVSNYAASQGGYRASTRSLQEPRTASISPGRGITRHRRGILPYGICNVSVGPQEIMAPLEGIKFKCLAFFVQSHSRGCVDIIIIRVL